MTRAAWRRRAWQMAGAGVLLVVVVAPFARHYTGIRAASGEAAANAATLASYLVPPANTLAGRWWLTTIDDRPGSIWGESTVFAGWTVLALAGLGVARLLRRRAAPRAWLFVVIAVTGFLLSLGPAPALPGGEAVALHRWMSALPGLAGMRAPGRFAMLVTLGLAGLAALGVEALLQRRSRTWRALVSLPDYTGDAEWFRGGDYVYYATSHWRPIVNGFGRSEPPGHADLISLTRRFPESAPVLAALGIQHVIVHGERFADGGVAMVAAASSHPACRLVTQLGADALFELVAPPPRP